MIKAIAGMIFLIIGVSVISVLGIEIIEKGTTELHEGEE